MTSVSLRKGAQSSLGIIKTLIRIYPDLKPERVCRIYLRELVNVTNCDDCAILLIDGDNLTTQAAKTSIMTVDAIENVNKIPAILNVLNTKQTVVDKGIAETVSNNNMLFDFFIESVICAPVLLNEKLIGIIYLDSVKTDAFDKDDISFIEYISKQLSLVLKQYAQYPQVVINHINDGLTGCPNRSKFDQDINQEITQAKLCDDELSLLLINIDKYQDYKSKHGQIVCNHILKKVACILKAIIRAYHSIYRYEEDKFAILSTGSDKKSALAIAKRVKKAIESEEFALLDKIGEENTIIISTGIATFSVDGENADKLTEVARLNLCRVDE